MSRRKRTCIGTRSQHKEGRGQKPKWKDGWENEMKAVEINKTLGYSKAIKLIVLKV